MIRMKPVGCDKSALFVNDCESDSFSSDGVLELCWDKIYFSNGVAATHQKEMELIASKILIGDDRSDFGGDVVAVEIQGSVANHWMRGDVIKQRRIVIGRGGHIPSHHSGRGQNDLTFDVDLFKEDAVEVVLDFLLIKLG